jgi:putative membrane protein
LLRQFQARQNTKSHVWFRWFNEIPVIALLIVVLLVVLKPF